MKEALKKLTRAVIACMLVLAVFGEASVAGAAQKVTKTKVTGCEGWLDPKGEIAVSDGLALVNENGKLKFVDKKGKTVIKCGKYDAAYGFQKDLLWCEKAISITVTLTRRARRLDFPLPSSPMMATFSPAAIFTFKSWTSSRKSLVCVMVRC